MGAGYRISQSVVCLTVDLSTFSLGDGRAGYEFAVAYRSAYSSAPPDLIRLLVVCCRLCGFMPQAGVQREKGTELWLLCGRFRLVATR